MECVFAWYKAVYGLYLPTGTAYWTEASQIDNIKLIKYILKCVIFLEMLPLTIYVVDKI